jgi:lipopolysaccharide heptosyltransferase I
MRHRLQEYRGASVEALRRCEFERILLIKLSAVGDVVHTLPVFAKIRERYPAAQIDWLITPQCADLVRWHPGLSNVLLYPRREFLRSWAGTTAMARLIGNVKRARYELVVDIHGQLRTAALVMASGAPVRIGFAVTREGARLSYTHHIPVPSMDYHAADRNLWLGDLLGFNTGAPDFTIHLSPQADVDAMAALSRLGFAQRSFAVIFPGTVWQTKHWSVEGFADVCRYLAGQGLGILLGGSQRDRRRSAAVAQLFPDAVDICGQTSLAALCAIMQRAAICVTNDSGPMHLAAALGIPLVSAFGPTSPVRTGPYGRPKAVVRVDVPCSPCYIRKLRSCPHGHRCMTALSSSMMIERIESALAEAATPPAASVSR